METALAPTSGYEAHPVCRCDLGHVKIRAMQTLLGKIAATMLAAAAITGCNAQANGHEELVLPGSAAEQYEGAYMARVTPAPAGDDMAERDGEYVVVENKADIRYDVGGWYIEDADGNRLNLGIGRQIEVGGELRVYSSCGESTDEAVFACAEDEVLDDKSDVLTLRDSAGGEVAEFAYGDKAK